MTDSGKFHRSVEVVREFSIADFGLVRHDPFLGYLSLLPSPTLMFGVFCFVFTSVIHIWHSACALCLILGIVFYDLLKDRIWCGVDSLVAKTHSIKEAVLFKNLIISASSAVLPFRFASESTYRRRV